MVSWPETRGYAGLAAIVCFVASVVLNERMIASWRHKAGFAPLPSTTREGIRQYKKQFWKELPQSVRRRSQLLRGIGLMLLALGFWLNLTNSKS